MSETLSFEAFGLPDFVLSALKRMNIETPTPIQAASIPPAMEGRDILASAQTGTGKTMSYILPLIHHLDAMKHGSALILTPTRELAIQVRDNVEKLLGRKSPLALLIGGESMFKQYAQIRRSPKLIIGTPGRVTDHLNRGSLFLDETQFLVLDETDRMLDIGFSAELEIILSHLPAERQTLMFSATMPNNIVKLSEKYLKNPERIAIGSTTQPIAKIKQDIIRIKASDKFSHLLKELEVRDGSVIIFVKTKIGAEQLAERLQRQDHSADAIHGDLHQRRRERVIQAFRNRKHRIMVATDVAARGLDVPHIKHVINYDLPQCPEDYIHRIGRTGRAGEEGSSLCLIAPEDDHKWKQIHRLMNPNIPDDKKSFQKPYQGKRSGGGFKRNGPARSFKEDDGKKQFRKPRENSFEGSEGRPARKSFGKSFDGAEGRPARKSFERSFGGSEGRSERRPFERSSGGAEGRPARRSFGGSEGRSERRPFERSFGGSEGRSERRPFERSSGGAEGRSARGSFGGSEGRSERKPFERSFGGSEGRPARKSFSSEKSFDASTENRPKRKTLSLGKSFARSEGSPARKPFEKSFSPKKKFFPEGSFGKKSGPKKELPQEE